MYTQCPNCHTVFRLHAGQVAQAQGQVRCGACQQAFNALISLSDRPNLYNRAQQTTLPSPSTEYPSPGASPIQDIQSDADTTDAGSQPSPPADADTIPSIIGTSETPIPGDAALVARYPLPTTEPDVIPPSFSLKAERTAPDSISAPPAPARKRRWIAASWILANALLVLLLLGQYVYFQRETLAQYPSLRPWITAVCNLMGCQLSLRRDPTRFSLAQRSIQVNPARPNTLQVAVVLVNDANFRQPYPLLELKFSDLNGHTVAGRRFLPREYLAAGVRLDRGVPPHQPVSVQFEIADPGPDAVGFQFDLL